MNVLGAALRSTLTSLALSCALSAGCGSPPAPQDAPDAATAAADAAVAEDGFVSQDSPLPTDVFVPEDSAAGPLDCATLETLAPGYERLPIAFTFSAEPAPRGPRASPRAIASRTVYRRTGVAQYGGTRDAEAPLPTLIAFEFDAGSDQLAGSYCVVQATSDGAGGVEHGHYPITFTPRADYYVTARLGRNVFPIGFDGTADSLTIYVASGGAEYLESYERVATP